MSEVTKVTLVVEEVEKRDAKGNLHQSDVTLVMDRNAPISSVWDKLKDLGYEQPVRLDRGLEYWTKYEQKHLFCPHTEVEVVGEKSAIDETHIYVNDPLVAHSNRLLDVKFDMALESASEADLEDLAGSSTLANIQANAVVIDTHLSVTFHRTVRMPDDDRLHSLPASVGAFPLYNVADYAARLPANIRDKGGVFLPMWQREALWINFNSLTSRAYAIRVYLGHVNAVTGKSMMEKEANQNDWEIEQDYVIVPGQNWIDGICVAPGVVRQFVAMPLGSGYTVEGQKTGEEKHGGIQLEIIPSYEMGLRKWLKEETPEALDDASLFLDEMRSPQQLGLNPGDKLLLYPKQATFTRAVIMGDLVQQDSNGQDMDTVSVKTFYTRKYKTEWANCSDKDSAMRRWIPRVLLQTAGASLSSNTSRRGLGSRNETVSDYSFGPDSDDDQCFSAAAPEYAPVTVCESIIEPDIGAGSSIAALLENAPIYGDDSGDDSGDSAHMDDASGCADDYCLPETGTPDELEGRTSLLPPASPIMLTPPTMPKPPPAPSLNIKAMGLAAGGKLIQDIVSDPFPDGWWNVAAARIIHVHILDPASCEKITHIVPPPVPISAYQAIEAQLPFFVVEEQIDNRVEGGDFDNVKSVAQMDDAKGVAGESSDPNASTMCQSCEKRLCDCIIRPCNHQFCNVCIQALEKNMESTSINQVDCPQCKTKIAHVAGFAAPMNLPGEESIRTKMPVHVLKVEDGRIEFQSTMRIRI